MRPELDLGILSGRLECPNKKCKAQVGKYAWQGMRCSCGVWVCPAFSLLKGRCDEITGGKRIEAGSRGAGGIRLPPGMRGGGNVVEKGSLWANGDSGGETVEALGSVEVTSRMFWCDHGYGFCLHYLYCAYFPRYMLILYLHLCKPNCACVY